VVGIGGLFTLARFSEAFLVLRAQQSGMPLALVPLVMVAMNLVYAASAYPFGRLSDWLRVRAGGAGQGAAPPVDAAASARATQRSHERLLMLGLLLLIAADCVLAVSAHWAVVLTGVAIWGLHLGLTQGLLATMVADTAPAALRGTAYGMFNLVCGVALLLASVLAGLLWDRLGAAWTFWAGALICVLTLVVLLVRRGAR
jgi:MFS family permease